MAGGTITPVDTEDDAAHEVAGGTCIVDKNGNLIEFIPDIECIRCGDAGPWVDEATEFCEACYEHVFPDEEFPE